MLLDELGRYRPELLERPRLVVGSKADVATESFDGMHISAVTAPGLDEFLGRVADLVARPAPSPTRRSPSSCCGPQEEGFSVVQEAEGVWRVQGRLAERAVSVADLSDPDAMVYVQQRLQKMGVERALRRAPARATATSCASATRARVRGQLVSTPTTAPARNSRS